MGTMIWPVLTLILNQKLGMDATGVAIVTLTASIAFLPADLIGGKIADRCNKKMVIVYCDLVSIILYLIASFIPLTLGTIVLSIIAAGFQGIERPAYDSLIADITLTKDRTKAFSLMYLGMNLGMVATPTIAGLLFVNYLWLSFLISGTSIALSTILIFVCIKDVTPVSEESEEASYQASRDAASLWTILKENPVIVLYTLLTAFFWAAYHQYTYLMPLDISRVHGEEGALIFGSVSSLNCVIVVIFTPLLTTLFSRTSHTRKTLYGMLLVLLGYVLFLLFLGTIPVYYAAMALFTFGEILSTITCGPYLTERIPASHRGRINGFSSVLQSILQGCLLFTTGRLFDTTGSVSAWTVVFAVILVSIIACIALIPLDKKRYISLYKK